MSIVIIGSKNSGTKNSPEVIAASIRRRGLDVRCVYWEQLVFSATTGSATVFVDGQDVFGSKIDLVIAVGWYKNGDDAIYRDVAYAFSQIAAAKNVSLWNSEMAMQRSTTKLSCMVLLALNNVSIPATQFSLDSTLTFGDAAVPFVAKSPSASRGNDNYLLQNQAEVESLRAKSGRYLVQPFLENDHDLRVICFAGEPYLVLRRSRARGSATHLNNTSQGGVGEWISITELSVQLLTECRKICKIMGREMAGIDFIPDEKSPYGYSCLEVNAVPQLTSGVDVDSKMDALVDAVIKFGESK